MNEIRVLDKETIDKIAAGEVVERPASVVKELAENSIDAGASSVSVEIRDGGKAVIRVSDNGSGIPADQVRTAVLRHATSKIRDAADLSFVTSLGFRGEALSSIAGVSDMEICTKTADSLTGTIYKIKDGRELSLEEAALPNGTTIIVRDLFRNVPARLKFLSSGGSEAGKCLEAMQRIALSHPEISVKFTSNGTIRLVTSGNGDLKDVIYAVFGREIASHLIEVHGTSGMLRIDGFIGKPEISRSTRVYENYFVNGRYIKNKTIANAIEGAYNGYQMKGSFPFTVFSVTIEPELMDVNVHPSKLEIRFSDNEEVYECILDILSRAVRERENIQEFSARTFGTSYNDAGEVQETEVREELPQWRGARIPEPFEKNRADGVSAAMHPEDHNLSEPDQDSEHEWAGKQFSEGNAAGPNESAAAGDPVQRSFFDDDFISLGAKPRHKIIGSVFDTYWIVEYEDKMYMIDQHAAHEKVLYEEFMEKLRTGRHNSQMISPGIIFTLSPSEQEAFRRYEAQFRSLGFQIESFGGAEFIMTEIPTDLYSLNSEKLFLSFIDELTEIPASFSSELLLDRVATAACKAAVKGENRLSYAEADELITRLLSLDNPYNCPHGRPTIITMSRTELDKKFKRII